MQLTCRLYRCAVFDAAGENLKLVHLVDEGFASRDPRLARRIEPPSILFTSLRPSPAN